MKMPKSSLDENLTITANVLRGTDPECHLELWPCLANETMLTRCHHLHAAADEEHKNQFYHAS